MDFIKKFIKNYTNSNDGADYNKISLPFPSIILNNEKVKYYNPIFKSEFKITDEESISEILKLIDTNNNRQVIEFEGRIYDTYIMTQSNKDDKIILFIPEKNSVELNDANKIVVGYIYIDNYTEVMDSSEYMVRPMVEALIDRKLGSVFKNFNAILQKYDKDKYLVIMKYSEYLKMKSDEFKVIEEVKKIKVSSGIPITISIGLGVNGLNIQETKLFANTAIDLALGRGGDQVIMKNGDGFEMFGGNSEEFIVNNKVRARVKSNILCELIESAENIVVMGHKYPDLDCLGACIGINKIAQTLGKDCNIVLNEVTTSIKNVYEKLVSEKEFDENVFITNDKCHKYIKEQTLVIVVDVNKKDLTENPEVVELASKLVLIDHHRRAVDSIKGTVLTYHEPAASSTSELIIDLLGYMKTRPKFLGIEADTLLAGIIIDTKNFTFKTSAKTFESAAYLKRNGADAKRVNFYLQSDISEYRVKTEIVNSAIIHDEIAISKCYEKLENPILTISQAADELLNLLGIEVAFVIAKKENVVYVSARSFGQFNVQEIMEQLGGGGHKTMAATQVIDKSIDEVEKMILTVLNIEKFAL